MAKSFGFREFRLRPKLLTALNSPVHRPTPDYMCRRFSVFFTLFQTLVSKFNYRILDTTGQNIQFLALING